jgi:hypothetical protein
LQLVTTVGALVVDVHVTSSQELNALATAGVHVATGVGPVAVTGHVVVV